MHPFEAHICNVLEKAKARQERRPVTYLAAVSGGADSTAMLAALASLRGDEGFALHCVHVEHGIRPAEESRADALAVKDLCRKLKVHCRVISVPPGRIAACAGKGGPGIEAAARFFRHKALRQERRRVKADWILTAHTHDDLLETLLMRVLRGSGPAGLGPMPQTSGRLFRPLLDFRRTDVLEYLKVSGIPYSTDSTNSDITYLRNRLRLKLIPVLEEFFTSWRSSLVAMAKTQALAAAFLASEVQKRLPWEEAAKPFGKTSLRLREADFLAAPLILREEAVFAGADTLAASGGLKNHVPRRAAVRRAVERGDAEDLGPVRLEKRGCHIYLAKKEWRAGERGFSLLIKEAGLYTLKAGVLYSGSPPLSVRVSSAGDTEVVPSTVFSATLPLVFRNHTEGDLILKGGRKRRFSDILDRDVYSGYTGVITACDSGGTAAFIGVGGALPVICRDDASAPCDNYFFGLTVEGKNV